MNRPNFHLPPRLLLPACFVVALGCDPDDASEESASSATMSSSGAGTTVVSSSSGETSSGTTDAAASSGSSGSDRTGGSSEGTSSGGGSTSDSGSSGSSGSTAVDGQWADCFHGEDCDSPDATCTMVPQQEAATCTFAPDPAVGCVDASECPAPPATGDAVVTCGDMDFDPTHNECYLDCSGGQTCPDGQACFNGQVCAFPTVETVGPYEACNGEDVICEVGSICFNDTFPATLGVCMPLGCASVAACAPGPAGSTVACGEVSPVLLGNECYLECSVDPDCPAGMQCFLDQLCVWPL